VLEWHEYNTTAQNKINTGRSTATHSREQVDRFGQYGLSCGNSAFPSQVKICARLVNRLTPIQQADESTSIQKKLTDHGAAF
jgi:hypothetical protein